MDSSADGKLQPAAVLGEPAEPKTRLPEEVLGVVARAIIDAEGGEPRLRLAADSLKVEVKCQPEEKAASPARTEPAVERRRADEGLTRQEAYLRESVRRLFEPLEIYVKKELECFRERLKAEREERCDAVKQLTREMSDTRDALSRKVAEIDDHISELLYRQLREEILQHSLRFGEELQRRQEEHAALEERFNQFREGLLDRSALADVLIEAGTRLKNECQPPAGEQQGA